VAGTWNPPIHYPTWLGSRLVWRGDNLGLPDKLPGHAGLKTHLGRAAGRDFLSDALNSPLERRLRDVGGMLLWHFFELSKLSNE
jgi:hypothetical protein